MKLLMEYLKKYCEVDCMSVIVGDYSMQKIGWTVPTRCTDYISTLFTNLVSRDGFTQFVDLCTHGENLLDLVLSNDKEIVCSISAKPASGT